MTGRTSRDDDVAEGGISPDDGLVPRGDSAALAKPTTESAKMKCPDVRSIGLAPIPLPRRPPWRCF